MYLAYLYAHKFPIKLIKSLATYVQYMAAHIFVNDRLFSSANLTPTPGEDG